MDDIASQRQLSVAVAAWSGIEALRRCLRSLRSQLEMDADEVVVARNFQLTGNVGLQTEFPWVTDLAFPSDVTVPQLRAAALHASRGVIVAFLEDHCACAPGWRSAMVSAHRLPFEAVGGPVDLAPGGRPLDWAVYFYDYSRFAPPMPSGAVRSLSGANVSYRRQFLEQLGSALILEVTEVALQDALVRHRAGAYLASDAIVVHRKQHAAVPAVRLSFALARGYASHRLHGAGPFRRTAFALAALGLPVLLAGRISVATLRTRRNLGRLVIAGPWLLVLVTAWSAGEFTGYLAGAGDSQLRWR